VRNNFLLILQKLLVTPLVPYTTEAAISDY